MSSIRMGCEALVFARLPNPDNHNLSQKWARFKLRGIAIFTNNGFRLVSPILQQIDLHWQGFQYYTTVTIGTSETIDGGQSASED